MDRTPSILRDAGDRRRKLDTPPLAGARVCEAVGASSCSSSIGKNSDPESGSGVEDAGEIEVQSAYSGPLGTMDALEESLPIRRGISNFYSGKARSFATLADAVSSCAPAKDLAKPENAYSRKRRNLLAFKYIWDKPHNNPLRSAGGGIYKRPPNSNRSSLALAVALCSPESSSTNTEEEHDLQWLPPPLHTTGRPALASSPPQKYSIPTRSFSLTDLKGMIGDPSSTTGHNDKHKGLS